MLDLFFFQWDFWLYVCRNLTREEIQSWLPNWEVLLLISYLLFFCFLAHYQTLQMFLSSWWFTPPRIHHSPTVGHRHLVPHMFHLQWGLLKVCKQEEEQVWSVIRYSLLTSVISLTLVISFYFFFAVVNSSGRVVLALFLMLS